MTVWGRLEVQTDWLTLLTGVEWFSKKSRSLVRTARWHKPLNWEYSIIRVRRYTLILKVPLSDRLVWQAKLLTTSLCIYTLAQSTGDGSTSMNFLLLVLISRFKFDCPVGLAFIELLYIYHPLHLASHFMLTSSPKVCFFLAKGLISFQLLSWRVYAFRIPRFLEQHFSPRSQL